MKETTERFLKRLDHVVWKVVDGKGILLNLENGSYYEVDPVGLSIWQKSDGKTKFSEIADAIAEEFDADLTLVQQDLQDFAKELKRKQMVQILDKPESISGQY